MVSKIKKILNKYQFFYNINLMFCNKKWRKKNKHNYTTMGNLFDRNCVEIGNATYGELNIKQFKKNNGKLKIKSFCSIAPEVVFILDGEHNYESISTYPFKSKYLGQEESFSKGDICIENDVWIGYGATILSGVHIGQGAIIGAKSVVAKDIPPYAIYVGNKVVKYRFNEEIIQKLLKFNYENLNNKNIDSNIETLYLKCNNDNIDNIIIKLMGE